MIHLGYKIATKLKRKIVDKLVLKQQIDIVCRTTFHPFYRLEMNQLSRLQYFEDNGLLSMIRGETTILKVLEGVKSVSQSLKKLLVVTDEGRAHQPGAWSPDRSWEDMKSSDSVY